jgi:hypothetical protein
MPPLPGRPWRRARCCVMSSQCQSSEVKSSQVKSRLRGLALVLAIALSCQVNVNHL